VRIVVTEAALATRRIATGHAAALHAAVGPVPRRVFALLADPPAGRGSRFRVAVLATAALLALIALSSLDAADDLHESFEVASVVVR